MSKTAQATLKASVRDAVREVFQIERSIREAKMRHERAEKAAEAWIKRAYASGVTEAEVDAIITKAGSSR